MACCILLDINSVFCKNIIFGILAISFARFGFSKFSGLFSTYFEISVWNLVYTCSRWCYTSSSSFIPIGTLGPTLQPKIVQSHLSALMTLKTYRGLRFGTHTYIVCVLIPTDFRHGWAIFGPLADKNTWKGVLPKLPASEKFSGLFCTFFEISVWNLAYTFSGWCYTSSSRFIPI